MSHNRTFFDLCRCSRESTDIYNCRTRIVIQVRNVRYYVPDSKYRWVLQAVSKNLGPTSRNSTHTRGRRSKIEDVQTKTTYSYTANNFKHKDGCAYDHFSMNDIISIPFWSNAEK